MVVGMMWQFVVSLAILRHELGGLHWPSIKKRIWLNLPRDPRTGKTRKVLFLWAVPAIAANVLGGFLALRLDTAWTNWLPGLDEPSYANLQVLSDPHFQGQWWILGLALTSHAVQLPSRRGTALPWRAAAADGRCLRPLGLGREHGALRALPRAQDLGLAEHDHHLLRPTPGLPGASAACG